MHGVFHHVERRRQHNALRLRGSAVDAALEAIEDEAPLQLDRAVGAQLLLSDQAQLAEDRIAAEPVGALAQILEWADKACLHQPVNFRDGRVVLLHGLVVGKGVELRGQGRDRLQGGLLYGREDAAVRHR
eukprot:2970712-Lingulodinium_polyedra.AAC.1